MFSVFKKIKKSFQAKAIVLMYHRVIHSEYDPWQLCVSPQNFEDQLKILQQHYTVLPIKELLQNLKTKTLKRNSIAITFDDGYADNLMNAKDTLSKYNLPATFFIATGYTGVAACFWWDKLEDIFLRSLVLPAHLEIMISGSIYYFSIIETVLTDQMISAQSQWIWPEATPTDRCRLYLEIWEKLLPLPLMEIKVVIENLISWSAYHQPVPVEKLPMHLRQLKELALLGLNSIGVHTVTHPALPFHSKQVQADEVNNCKKYLKDNVANYINCIAYPYGRYDKNSIAVMMEAGMDAAFTTNEQIINTDSNLFELGRFQVCNWTGAEFYRQLKNWLN